MQNDRNAREERLQLLIKEASGVILSASKNLLQSSLPEELEVLAAENFEWRMDKELDDIQASVDRENNEERLTRKLDDLQAIILLMSASGDLRRADNSPGNLAKTLKRKREFMHHQNPALLDTLTLTVK